MLQVPHKTVCLLGSSCISSPCSKVCSKNGNYKLSLKSHIGLFFAIQCYPKAWAMVKPGLIQDLVSLKDFTYT